MTMIALITGHEQTMRKGEWVKSHPLPHHQLHRLNVILLVMKLTNDGCKCLWVFGPLLFLLLQISICLHSTIQLPAQKLATRHIFDVLQ